MKKFIVTFVILLNLNFSFTQIQLQDCNFCGIYPNPATDVLNIKMNEEIASVVITASNNKVVVTETSTLVNISGLNTGIYIAKMNNVCVKLFIKN